MWRYISTGPWRIVVIHPVNSRNWLWISPVTTRYIILHIHWGEPSLTTGLVHHNSYDSVLTIVYMYMCTHRASTPNAHLSPLATRQPTHRVRSSWTMRSPSRAYANSWSLPTYTAVLKIFAEWAPHVYNGIIVLCLSTVLVSWHLLGRVLQSSAVDLLTKADSLLDCDLQYENEFGSSRLG